MKRRLLIILLFLLAGAVVNVAVAWALAAIVDDPDLYGSESTSAFLRLEPADPDGIKWEVHSSSTIGTTAIQSFRWRGDPQQGLLMHDDSTNPSQLIPASFSLGTLPGPIEFERRWFTSRGWPMRALWCEEEAWLESAGNRTRLGASGGAALPDWGPRSRFGYPRVLPLRPIWIGFAVNTILYWLILLCPAWALIALRRHIRRHRGRCLKCGYNLRGEFDAACPECGCGR